jgi:M6 family metalloprotease-like protein
MRNIARTRLVESMRPPVAMAVLLLGICAVPSRALEPPRPGQIEQYIKDGTLAEKIAAAEALGNHKVSPRLAWDANRRLVRAVTGEDPPESMAPPTCWQGGLPTSGNPKVLTILIAFSDTPPVTGDTQPLIASKLFGDGTDGLPYDSLRNFYRRSSYNQLDIGGNALGWYTTSYPRSGVPETDTGREGLIEEALNYYDAQGHDFSQYDNDGDGRIDYFAVVWTGAHGAWATFWWGYQTWFGDSSFTLDGKSFGAYSWQWESYSYPSGLFEPSTLIHETGHALGLPDYYDYDGSVGPDGGLGNLDQMDGYGDHNCFSKFLLDWISPTVCNAGGAHIATLHPSESSQDTIIAMPTATSGNAFAEYFMIQVRNRTGNDVWYPNDGILIWHVDARLDMGNCDYLYNNSYTEHKLLRLMEADGQEDIENNQAADAGDYYTQGKSFGNTTVPNSKRYDGTPTGVTANTFSPYADPMTFNLDCAACTLSCTATAPASGLVGQALAFQSTGTIAPATCGTPAFAWDFDGDGTTDSTLQNPSHSYNSPGTYTWKLTVTGANTPDQCVRTGTVSITRPCTLTCTAVVPSTGTAGTPVSFRSTATFTPTSCGLPMFVWDFDNNGTTDSSQQNPSYTYSSPGTYVWKLTIIGSGGAGTCAKSGTITIGEACALSCTATVPATATAGQGTTFQSTATPSHCTGSPLYAWTFGDGTGSTQQNPSYTYANSGTFTWTMTASVEGVHCTQTGSITVTSPCILDCTATVPATAASGQGVFFQATATPSQCAGSPAYGWTFGDGGTSATQNPTHTYASAGSFIWTLTVTMDGKTCAKTGAIAVSEPCAVTCAATVPGAGRAGDPVAFFATADATHCSGNPSFSWAFGDGATSAEQNPSHVYAVAGNYTWTLTVTAEGQTCARGGILVISEPCTLTCGGFAGPATGPVPLPAAFFGSSTATGCEGEPSFIWAFGDGTNASGQNASHIYAAIGTYTWTLTVTVEGRTCSRSGEVTVTPPCVLTCEASTSPDHGTAPLTVAFVGSAAGTNCVGAPEFRWDFGDGSFSGDPNPSHTFQAQGTFHWTLTVIGGFGSCEQNGSVTVYPGLPGDGNSDGLVSIGEVQQAINMFLEMQTPGNGVDCSSDGTVSIGEVQKVINAFLGLASSC